MEAKEKIFNLLYKKYGSVTIIKSNLAEEMNCSVSYINKCIMRGENIPSFKKLGDSKNSKVVFNLWDVAEFLTNGTKVFYAGV